MPDPRAVSGSEERLLTVALTTIPGTPIIEPALGAAPCFGVSATLAANEILAARGRRGEPVLHLAFGEAGLDVHPLLRDALADAAGRNAYGPVAGLPALREAVAGYWVRRDLQTLKALLEK